MSMKNSNATIGNRIRDLPSLWSVHCANAIYQNANVCVLILKSFQTSAELEHMRNYSVIKLIIKFEASPGVNV